MNIISRSQCLISTEFSQDWTREDGGQQARDEEDTLPLIKTFRAGAVIPFGRVRISIRSLQSVP